jgi:hypothetical protein
VVIAVDGSPYSDADDGVDVHPGDGARQALV